MGPRRLRDRRAAVRGELGQPGAGGVVRDRASCELVGLYHAGYKGHGALNVVVGIDQLAEFMKKKRRMPRALTARGSPGAPVAAERGRARAWRRHPALLRFGGLHVRAEMATATCCMYHVYGREFPLDDRRIAVLEDSPDGGGLGEIGAAVGPGDTGWHEGRPPTRRRRARPAGAARRGDARADLRAVDYRRALANPSSRRAPAPARDLLAPSSATSR